MELKSILYKMVIILVLSQQAKAQFQGEVYKQFTTPLVNVLGSSISAPWCGGINSVQVIQADLNEDGTSDLVLFDHNSNVLKTFLNIGTTGQIRYSYAPKYASNFPPVVDYLQLKDYNCDLIPDLFHKGSFGVAVYKGYYQNNELKFTFYKDLFFQGMFGPVNVYVQPGDIPSIIDYDHDGDLDILSYDVLGTRVAYYKNMQIENNAPCDSIQMSEFDVCWGKFYQGVHRAVSLGMTCKGNTAQGKKNRHTGNCIVHVDIEGDGDLDLLGGNISFADIQLLFNNGSDIIYEQDTTYQKNGHVLQMPTWPSPFHVDIDNDGDHDILITSHADNLSSANFNAVAYYKNLGTDAIPNFVFQHDTLLTSDMIDVGTYSYPTFFDFDKDGKKDLFVGSEGYLNNSTGLLESKLAYYRNTSTVGSISFELISKDFLQISSHQFNGLFPTFGDITGDGVDDLVLGLVNGSVAVFKNFAVSNTAAPNFFYYTDSIPGINVGNYSAPCVYDFNQDGKTDLIVGNQLGKLAYYEDTSSTNQKKLALKTVSLGNVKAGASTQLFGYAAPIIGRMDNVPKDFLLIGNVDGTLERYQDFANNWGTFTKVDSTYSYIKTTSRSVPAITDIDGDGNYDMVLGNKLGGLTFHKQVLTVNIPNELETPSSIDWVLYPNPVQNHCYIELLSLSSERNFELNLFNMVGQNVFSKILNANQKSKVSVEELPNGMYYAVITLEGRTYQKAFVKVAK